MKMDMEMEFIILLMPVYLCQSVALLPHDPALPCDPLGSIGDPGPVPLLLKVLGHLLEEAGGKGGAPVLGEVHWGVEQGVQGLILHPAHLQRCHLEEKKKNPFSRQGSIQTAS